MKVQSSSKDHLEFIANMPGHAVHFHHVQTPFLMLPKFKDVPFNNVLTLHSQVDDAIEQLKALDLRIHPDPPKNWDSLACLSIIAKLKPKARKILDAGGQYYSVLLPHLSALGIGEELIALNLAFKQNFNWDEILYLNGDITRTEFPKNYFDAVTCLSVIEHGVNPRMYFREMFRVLKPGGILVTSIDYWESEVDTRNQLDVGLPIKIFTRTDVEQLIEIASDEGFRVIDPVQYKCVDRVVHWKEFDLRFTFLYFTLVKRTLKKHRV